MSLAYSIVSIAFSPIGESGHKTSELPVIPTGLQTRLPLGLDDKHEKPLDFNDSPPKNVQPTLNERLAFMSKDLDFMFTAYFPRAPPANLSRRGEGLKAVAGIPLLNLL